MPFYCYWLHFILIISFLSFHTYRTSIIVVSCYCGYSTVILFKLTQLGSCATFGNLLYIRFTFLWRRSLQIPSFKRLETVESIAPYSITGSCPNSAELEVEGLNSEETVTFPWVVMDGSIRFSQHHRSRELNSASISGCVVFSSTAGLHRGSRRRPLGVLSGNASPTFACPSHCHTRPYPSWRNIPYMGFCSCPSSQGQLSLLFTNIYRQTGGFHTLPTFKHIYQLGIHAPTITLENGYISVHMGMIILIYIRFNAQTVTNIPVSKFECMHLSNVSPFVKSLVYFHLWSRHL